eukprot:jgi/Psemu1/25949/gm1.25949_g
MLNTGATGISTTMFGNFKARDHQQTRFWIERWDIRKCNTAEKRGNSLLVLPEAFEPAEPSTSQLTAYAHNKESVLKVNEFRGGVRPGRSSTSKMNRPRPPHVMLRQEKRKLHRVRLAHALHPSEAQGFAAI